ncbi:hypothetical protein VTI74DRAFT_5558 [Chaetomium olivicolor]
MSLPARVNLLKILPLGSDGRVAQERNSQDYRCWRLELERAGGSDLPPFLPLTGVIGLIMLTLAPGSPACCGAFKKARKCFGLANWNCV